jgi:hypothetical protein
VRAAPAAVAGATPASVKFTILTKEEHVPQISVTADMPSHTVMHSERVNIADFESEHFRAQLAERLAWAVGDADAVERALQIPPQPVRTPGEALSPGWTIGATHSGAELIRR